MKILYLLILILSSLSCSKELLEEIDRDHRLRIESNSNNLDASMELLVDENSDMFTIDIIGCYDLENFNNHFRTIKMISHNNQELKVTSINLNVPLKDYPETVVGKVIINCSINNNKEFLYSLSNYPEFPLVIINHNSLYNSKITINNLRL